MCILAVASKAHPDVPFVCVHNRDESVTRPTDPPNGGQTVWGGVDRLAGGMWFGFNWKNGSLAALTNFRSKLYPAPKPKADGSRTSRGTILRNAATDYASLPTSGDVVLDGEYSGFTMITANVYSDDTPLRVVSNRPQPTVDPEGAARGCRNDRLRVAPAASGVVHSFSNSHFGDYSWPKVAYLRDNVDKVLREWPVTGKELGAEGALRLVTALAGHMSSTTPFPESEYPDLSFTPVPDKEPHIQRSVLLPLNKSKPFGPTPKYGTRAQTIVIRTRSAVHMFYRNTEAYPDLGEWMQFCVPLPKAARTAPAATAGAGAGAGAGSGAGAGADGAGSAEPSRPATGAAPGATPKPGSSISGHTAPTAVAKPQTQRRIWMCAAVAVAVGAAVLLARKR